MNPDIGPAIDSFRRLSAKYSRPERYHRMEHDLSFATEKFQNAFGSLFRDFAMNLCPAIVDAVKDKLRINGLPVVRCHQLIVRREELRKVSSWKLVEVSKLHSVALELQGLDKIH